MNATTADTARHYARLNWCAALERQREAQGTPNAVTAHDREQRAWDDYVATWSLADLARVAPLDERYNLHTPLPDERSILCVS